MDLDRASILCNIAELVTREIEAEWAMRQQRLQCMSLLRTMESYKQAFMFVDVAEPGWRVLYMNDHAVERTGAFLRSLESAHSDEQNAAFAGIPGRLLLLMITGVC